MGSMQVVSVNVRLTRKWGVARSAAPAVLQLTIRFGRADVIKRFLRSGRNGFYLAVTTEGEIAGGDAISVIGRHPDAITIAEAAAR